MRVSSVKTTTEGGGFTLQGTSVINSLLSPVPSQSFQMSNDLNIATFTSIHLRQFY